MYIYRKTPLKGDTRTSPLLKFALGFAQQGWPILPVRPFHLHPHIQHPCPDGEPLCLATGWHALTDESLMHMTTNEDAIREWWTTWPDAYVCLLAAITRELKARPLPMGKHQLRKNEELGIIVYGWRDGKRCLAHAEAVNWKEREFVHPLIRDFLSLVQRQEKRDGGLCLEVRSRIRLRLSSN
jgi:hypothetical protein